jgi:hypothetical protein
VSIFLKDPGSSLDHAVDWDSLYLDGRSISTSQWSVQPEAPGGLVLSQPRLIGGRTAIRLSGGQAGQVYRVVNRISLSDGNSDERTLTVRVEDR